MTLEEVAAERDTAISLLESLVEYVAWVQPEMWLAHVTLGQGVALTADELKLFNDYLPGLVT